MDQNRPKSGLFPAEAPILVTPVTKDCKRGLVLELVSWLRAQGLCQILWGPRSVSDATAQMCITHFVNLRYAICVTLITAILASSLNCSNPFISAVMYKLGLVVYPSCSRRQNRGLVFTYRSRGETDSVTSRSYLANLAATDSIWSDFNRFQSHAACMMYLDMMMKC